jgi:uncharacterized protein YndB with AHSA1/START domain
VEDVWAFIAEPRHLADWWPGLGVVEPDRRGFAVGARWQVRRSERPTLLRRAHAPGLVLVREIEPARRFAFHLTAERLDAVLELEPAGPGTRATLSVAAPLLVGLRRSLPRDALSRLHALCQTAAQP